MGDFVINDLFDLAAEHDLWLWLCTAIGVPILYSGSLH
jgi:hypothetical protein